MSRLRSLLAALALSASKPVSVDHLAMAVWGEDLPTDARRAVRTYVTRLRAILGYESIVNKPAGYLLRAKPENIDALRFLQLVDEAALATDASVERGLLAQALDLWRGIPLEDVRSHWLIETETTRLEERRLAALERRIDLDTADGRDSELVAELRELTSHYPLRESLWARLLTILARSGRRAEALEQYERIRTRISDELGADPGPELQAIHAMLRTAGRTEPTVRTNKATGHRPVPQQLPTNIYGFVGRTDVLDYLDGLMVSDIPPGADRSMAVVISAIAGTAGVGKTTLAVHWAHRVADQFPDGQLYVNLRGFDPARKPLKPAEAIRGFLDALHVPPQRLPSSVEAQAGLYRSLLAGQRVLVVLDNAHDTEQVRPLLPGSSGCVVVVTSRNQLSGLVAAGGAHPVTLDRLTDSEAHQLLTRRLGPDRIAAEPRAVDTIIAACARLPLALAVVAARAVTRPEFSLKAAATELRHVKNSLDAFVDPDSMIDVRAVFSWSYRQLSPVAARLYRQLGIHPGPDISTAAAASLAGVSAQQVQGELNELCHANLLSEDTPGRFSFHDLLRAHATELTRALDSERDRVITLRRILDHYVHTAHAAVNLLHPQWDSITLVPALDGVTPEEFSDHRQAMQWFAIERPVLVTAVRHAAKTRLDTHACHLAQALSTFFERRGHWHDWVATRHTALAAARRSGDRLEQARAHRSLARAYSRQDRYTDAHVHLTYAKELYSQVNDRAGLAHSYLATGEVFSAQGNFARALDNGRKAIDLYRKIEHRNGEAAALNNIGWYHTKMGDHEQALIHCQRALDVQCDIDDRPGQAFTWDSLGYAHHCLGRHEEAIGCYQHALALLRDLGDRRSEAEILGHIGDTYAATGDSQSAKEMWQQSLLIRKEFDQSEVADVQAQVDELGHALGNITTTDAVLARQSPVT
jgi:DNA-binding SARP family transcriptional activator/Tfp pilus assembly protein PilF